MYISQCADLIAADPRAYERTAARHLRVELPVMLETNGGQVDYVRITPFELGGDKKATAPSARAATKCFTHRYGRTPESEGVGALAGAYACNAPEKNRSAR